MIEKMGETGIHGGTERMIQRYFGAVRDAELLAGNIERLETLCHCSASATFAGRQVSLTSQHFAYRNNSDRNFRRQEHQQFHCLPICSSDPPSS